MIIREAEFSFTYLGSSEDPLPTPLMGTGSFTARGDTLTAFRLEFNGAAWFLDDTLEACVCSAPIVRIPLKGDDFLLWDFERSVFTIWLETPDWTAIGSTPGEVDLTILSWEEHPVSAPEAFGLLLLGLIVLPLFSRRWLKWH